MIFASLLPLELLSLLSLVLENDVKEENDKVKKVESSTGVLVGVLDVTALVLEGVLDVATLVALAVAVGVEAGIRVGVLDGVLVLLADSLGSGVISINWVCN